VVSFKPRPFYSRGKKPRYPSDRRLGGPKSRGGHLVKRKFFSSGTRTPTPRPSSPQLVAITTPESEMHNLYNVTHKAFVRENMFPGWYRPNIAVDRMSDNLIKNYERYQRSRINVFNARNRAPSTLPNAVLEPYHSGSGTREPLTVQHVKLGFPFSAVMY
jgi:hypothetical protein